MESSNELVFDTRKIYFFGILVAAMYGLSPSLSLFIFGGAAYAMDDYIIYFIICNFVFFLIVFPTTRYLYVSLEINERRLATVTALLAVAFVVLQVVVYGGFERAFISSYTERTGTQITGNTQFIFYPILVAYQGAILLYSIYVYCNRKNARSLHWAILVISTAIFFALGSRNLLLWSFSAVAALTISRCRYPTITAVPIGIYLVAVLFAFSRNAGLIAYITNSIDVLAGDLSFAYFDPMAHEFSSSYRTFELISTSPDRLASAPFGLLESFIFNQLPLALKPDGFISFTNYISLQFADNGEGIGSSPMTELFLFGPMSLIFLCIVGVSVYWPAYYSKRIPTIGLFSYVLAVAVYFNIWRIGSAEIMKMFLSNVVMMTIIASICRFRVIGLEARS